MWERVMTNSIAIAFIEAATLIAFITALLIWAQKLGG